MSRRMQRVGMGFLFALCVWAMTSVLLFNPLGLGHEGQFESYEAGEVDILRATVGKTVEQGLWVNAGLLERPVEGPYTSNCGLSSWLPALLIRGMPSLSLDEFMNRYEILTAVATALVLVTFAFWVGREFGAVTAVVLVLLLSASDVFVFLGRNSARLLHQCWWPFLFTWVLFRPVLERRCSRWLFWGGLWALLFLRAASGYEYYSNVLLAACVGPIYVGVLQSMPWREMAGWLVRIWLVGVLAFGLALLLNVIQVSVLEGSLEKGYERVAAKAMARTFGADSGNSRSVEFQNDARSGLVSIPAMVDIALRAPATTFGFGVQAKPYALQSFSAFFALWIPLWLLALMDGRVLPVLARHRRQLLGLCAALTWAMLSSLSWIVLAPGWTEHHFHILSMGLFVVYMPFLFVVVGRMLTLGLSQVGEWLRG